MAAAGTDGAIHLRDLETGGAVGSKLKVKGKTRLSALAIQEQADGTRVIVASSTRGTVCTWDLETGQPVGEPVQIPDHHAAAIGRTKTGARMIVTSRENVAGTGMAENRELAKLRMRDLESGQLIGELEGHEAWPPEVAIGRHSDGSWAIVSGGDDNSLRIWEAESPIGDAEIESHATDAHSASNMAVAVLSDGTHVIVTIDSMLLRVSALDSGRSLREFVTIGSMNDVAVGERLDGTAVIVAGGSDCRIHIWDLETGRVLGDPLKGHRRGWTADGEVVAVAIGERLDGARVIVSGGTDKTVRVWNLDTGVALGKPMKHKGSVNAIAIGERVDGTRVIVSSSDDDPALYVWNLDTGKPLLDPLVGQAADIGSVAVGERTDGTRVIVSGSADGPSRVWDLDTGEPLGSPIEVTEVHHMVLGEASDGTPVLVTAVLDGTVRMWDLDDGSHLARCNVGSEILSLGIGASGRRIVVGASALMAIDLW